MRDLSSCDRHWFWGVCPTPPPTVLPSELFSRSTACVTCLPWKTWMHSLICPVQHFCPPYCYLKVKRGWGEGTETTNRARRSAMSDSAGQLAIAIWRNYTHSTATKWYIFYEDYCRTLFNFAFRNKSIIKKKNKKCAFYFYVLTPLL